MTDDSKEPIEAPNQEALRDELMGRFSSEKFGLDNREVAVMARMNSYIVEVLDAMVELEIFKSRSEAVASFVERMILSQKTLFDEIRKQANDIKVKRDAAKHLAYKAMQSRSNK